MKNLLRLVLLTALLVGATASLARPAPGHAAGTGGISGAVFFDADADGIRDAADNGLDAGLTVEIRDAANLGPVIVPGQPARLFAAAWISGVRLIDNIPVALP